MIETKSVVRKFHCIPADPNNPKDTGFCVHESAHGAIKGLAILTVEFSAHQKALDEIERLKAELEIKRGAMPLELVDRSRALLKKEIVRLNKLLEKAAAKMDRQHDALIATKELLDENARLKAILEECLEVCSYYKKFPGGARLCMRQKQSYLVSKLQKELGFEP